MAIGDVYQARVRYRSAYNVEAENVFFYIGTGDGLSNSLAQAMADDIVPVMDNLLPLDWNFYRIEVQSLFDPTDFFGLDIDLDGIQTVETTAPYTAINFTLRVPTRSIRPGSKRIGPVPEDVVTNGIIDDEDYLVLVEAMRSVMEDTIEPTGATGDTYDPVVVKRVKFTEDGKVKYRLPASFGEAVYANVTGVVVNSILSHQTSRQR